MPARSRSQAGWIPFEAVEEEADHRPGPRSCTPLPCTVHPRPSGPPRLRSSRRPTLGCLLLGEERLPEVGTTEWVPRRTVPASHCMSGMYIQCQVDASLFIRQWHTFCLGCGPLPTLGVVGGAAGCSFQIEQGRRPRHPAGRPLLLCYYRRIQRGVAALLGTCIYTSN